jgi:hypothetical protein
MKQIALLGADAQLPPFDVNQLPHALSSPAALAAMEAFNVHAPTRVAEKSKRGADTRGERDSDAQDDSKRPRDGSQPVAARSGITISNLNAVADFERELAAAAEYDAKANVFEALTKAMDDLVTFNPKASSYPLIVDCLRAMRRACVEQDLASTYIHALATMFEHKQNVADAGGLWCALACWTAMLAAGLTRMLYPRRAAIKAAGGLGPITANELQDSKNGMTTEAAAEFMAREPSVAPVVEPDTDNEAPDEEDADMDD